MAEKEMRAKITADDRDFKNKTERAKKQGKSFGETMAGVARMIAGAFILKKAYDGISRLIGGIMEMSDRLLDLSDITGMNTDELQEWQYVSRIAGVNTEAVSNAAQNLTNRFQNLHREQSPISRGFREMGIEAFDASGELRNTGAIVDDVITTLAEMENETERNAYGAQLFGGSWKDLAPILGMGAEGIEKVKQEARDMGIVMDKDAIDAANNLRQAKVRLSESAGALGREIGNALIPVLTKLSEVALDSIKSIKTLGSGLSAVASDENLSFWQKLRTYVGLGAGDVRSMGQMFASLAEEESKAVAAGEEVASTTAKQIKRFDENTATLFELTEEIKRLEGQKNNLSAADKEEIARVNELIDRYTVARDGLADYRTEVDKTTESTGAMVEPASEFTNVVERTDEEILGLVGDMEIANEQFERMPAAHLKIVDHMALATNAAKYFGESVMWASVQGEMGLKEYARTVANTARENIKAYMAEAIAATIKAHVGMGPVGLILAGVAAGAAAALFNQLVPAFAAGGAVSGPTLALVGEGPGVSRSNPEYIGTAAQLGQMNQGGGTAKFLRISQGDLIFAVNESHAHNSRSY